MWQHELLASSNTVGTMGDEPTAQEASSSDLFLHLPACPPNSKACSRHHLSPAPRISSLSSSCQVLVQRWSDKGPHICSQWAFLPSLLGYPGSSRCISLVGCNTASSVVSLPLTLLPPHTLCLYNPQILPGPLFAVSGMGCT